MADHDLRGFLDRLERGGRLQRIQMPVDPELESTSLCLRALKSGGPALLMEQPVGSNHALLGNLFGHRDRIEAALAGRPIASLRELGELLAAIKEPRWPSSLKQALSTWPELAQLAHVAPQRYAKPPSSTKPWRAMTLTWRTCQSSVAGPAMSPSSSPWGW